MGVAVEGIYPLAATSFAFHGIDRAEYVEMMGYGRLAQFGLVSQFAYGHAFFDFPEHANQIVPASFAYDFKTFWT